MSNAPNAGPPSIFSPTAADSIIHFSRMSKLEAVLQLLISLNMLAIYKWVAKATGWYHRDAKFHTALGELSRQSMKAGGGAVTAVVCSAGSDGLQTMPGRQFFTLLEEEDKTIKIKRIAGGELDPADCHQKWLDQLTKLGMDVTKLKK